MHIYLRRCGHSVSLALMCVLICLYSHIVSWKKCGMWPTDETQYVNCDNILQHVMMALCNATCLTFGNIPK